jgi:hypothetical protein
MPCFLGCAALFVPRLVLVLVWLFSGYLGRAYDSVLWPLLGFFFMPLTTLAYAFAMNAAGSVSGLYLVIVVLAVLVDLGLIGGGGREASRRKWTK